MQYFYKFGKLLEQLKALNLLDGEYAIFGSGPLAVRGIRESADLDIVVFDSLYKKMLERFPEKRKQMSKGEVGVIQTGDIEILSASNSLIDNPEQTIKRAELIDGFRFLLLEDIIAWKNKLGREKDFKDIQLVKDWLSKNNQNEN